MDCVGLGTGGGGTQSDCDCSTETQRKPPLARMKCLGIFGSMI